MFDELKSLPGDPILSIMAAYRADPSDDKVDLSTGVYKDPDGVTPVMAAVDEAEQKVLAEQTTKAYVGLAGSAAFNAAIEALVFGDEHAVRRDGRVHTLQTPGGSGALRVAAEFLKNVNPDVRLWLSDPSWPNHEPLISSAGIALERFPYFDRETGGVRFDEMLSALDDASPGDLVLLHGCCHNPTGADLSPAEWSGLADLCAEKGLVPFIDFAYQGFGDGLDDDAIGVRTMADAVPELVVAASCSKNFGLYRERVGSLSIVGGSIAAADAALSHTLRIVRRIYSMPPDHGAAIAATILDDPALRIVWQEELAEYRDRMRRLRDGFASALENAFDGRDFDFIRRQKGMFSMLPLTPEHVETLQREYHVYLVSSGRFNVAGLPDEGLERLAAAIAAASR